MGFSVCCLLCDAPDLSGTERCRNCISAHAKTREKLSLDIANTKSQRLVRELIKTNAEDEIANAGITASSRLH